MMACGGKIGHTSNENGIRETNLERRKTIFMNKQKTGSRSRDEAKLRSPQRSTPGRRKDRVRKSRAVNVSWDVKIQKRKEQQGEKFNLLFEEAIGLRIASNAVALKLAEMGSLYLPQEGGLNSSAANDCEKEMLRLVELFNEDNVLQIAPKYGKDCERSLVLRKKVAAHMEDSKSPFSALVNGIVEKLSSEGEQINLASAKTLVLEIGLRVCCGISNTDADPLEDNTPSSLWRWEVRELKLLPPDVRKEITEQRRIKRKITERLKSLSSAVEILRAANPESCESAVLKMSEILQSTEDEVSIRAAKMEWLAKKSSGQPTQQQSEVNSNGLVPSFSPNSTQENSKRRRRSDPEEREKLRQEKLLKRQRIEEEKEQRRKEAEKEKEQRRKEAEKEKEQRRKEAEKEKEAERELKRKEREEAEKRKESEREQRRKEKEESERKKEAEKEQRRKEKEEAERKKQMAIQKQASFMGRFLQASKKEPKQQLPTPDSQEAPSDDLEGKAQSTTPRETESSDIVTSMDVIFQKKEDFDLEVLKRQHISSWREIHHQMCRRKPLGWGTRRKPKTFVFRELRLQGANSSPDEGTKRISGAESSPKRLRPEIEDEGLEDVDWKGNNPTDSCPDTPSSETKKLNSDKYLQLRNKRKKLLQFDKSYRPPYYGTFSKSSDVIKPRNPLKQDPKLDYEVDSDGEWEEEEPGESLSDFENEKDEEEDRVDHEDDEDSSDEFMVPDGYLSEGEGVHMEAGASGDEAGPCGTSEGFPLGGQCVNDTGTNGMSPDQLRKILDKVTDHALRTNRPLIINNLRRGSQEENSVQQLTKRESLILEALRMRILTSTTIGVS
ncbi:hypothetical protein R1flu_016330 [Riccia fluitans]|uniref:Chromatin assembly factor 1 subunit A dimerization domain-containing protein n=1 Tax=Riccia fluitans TaxID=41844 RepID=A0ABD1YPP5_9MARC